MDLDELEGFPKWVHTNYEAEQQGCFFLTVFKMVNL